MRPEIKWQEITGYPISHLQEVFWKGSHIDQAYVLRNAGDFLTSTTDPKTNNLNDITIRTPAVLLLGSIDHQPHTLHRVAKTNRILGENVTNVLTMTRNNTNETPGIQCDLDYFELQRGRSQGIRLRPSLIVSRETKVRCEFPFGEISDLTATKIADTPWIRYGDKIFSQTEAMTQDDETFAITDTNITQAMMGTLILGLDPEIKLGK